MAPRKLSESEIDTILDFIVPRRGIPKEIAARLYRDHKASLANQLKNELVEPKAIPDLKRALEEMYYKSQVQAGESVGILTAQSIGEKNTQSTLNTFHKAGMAEKTVVAGVPRFWELLNATRCPKAVSCIIPFKTGNSSLQELKKTINHSLVELTVGRLAESIVAVENKDSESWYDTFKLLYNDNFSKFQHCVSIKFNPKILYEHRIDMEEIATAIEAEYGDLFCVYSPLQDCRMDIFVNTNVINAPDEIMSFVTEENMIRVYLQEVVVPNIESFKVCGVSGILEVFYTTDRDGKWIVETENRPPGKTKSEDTTFADILALDIVDSNNVLCNNMWEIYNTLGVEAARQFLIEEFMNIMAGINTCHIKLMVDRMTFGGSISAISRYAMRNDGSGALGKASFEETLDNLLNAAVYGERESTDGVSASVICGKLGKFGTGLCELKVDVAKLPGAKQFLDDLVFENN